MIVGEKSSTIIYAIIDYLCSHVRGVTCALFHCVGYYPTAMSSNELEAGSTADSAPGNGGLPADPEGRTPAGVTEDLTAVVRCAT